MNARRLLRYDLRKDKQRRGLRKAKMDQRRMAEENAKAAREEREAVSEHWEPNSQEEY